MEFQPVRCPSCGAVVMEIATGMARGRCPGRYCRRRVWAVSDGSEVRIGMVDAPQRKLKPLPVGRA